MLICVCLCVCVCMCAHVCAGGSSALATIANAFTRVLPDDEALFQHLESALVLMPPSAFDAQTLAVVW